MEDQTIIVLVSLLSTMFFVVMRQINKNLFSSILMIPLADQFIKMDEHETSNKRLSFTLFQVLSFLAIALTIRYYDVNFELNIIGLEPYLGSEFKLIFWSLMIGVFFLLKALMEHIAFHLLDMRNILRSFIKYKLLLVNYCSVLMVPVILINEFNDFDLSVQFNHVITGLIIIYALGQLLYMTTQRKLILNNLHYFILYLCTFEFGTYFVVYHLMID